MKKMYTTILCMFVSLYRIAHNITGQQTKMADVMRSNGKIYVVMAFMLTILAGLLLYLVRLDKKVLKLEEELQG